MILKVQKDAPLRTESSPEKRKKETAIRMIEDRETYNLLSCSRPEPSLLCRRRRGGFAVRNSSNCRCRQISRRIQRLWENRGRARQRRRLARRCGMKKDTPLLRPCPPASLRRRHLHTPLTRASLPASSLEQLRSSLSYHSHTLF